MRETRGSTSQPALLAVAPPSGLTLAGLLGIVALSAVDGTIVSTAMPRVVEDIGGLALYAWASASFLLANTLATPFFGRYADRHGVRPALAGSLAMFLLGSGLAGASGTMGQLVATRAIQGAGVGGMVTVAFAAFALLYPPEKRGRIQSMVGVVWGVASLAGPVLGGCLVSWAPWPWIFWLNLPLGVGVAIVAALGLPMGALPRPAAAATLASQSLWRSPGFTVSLLLGGGACLTLFPAISFIPLYVQVALGLSAPEAGALLTPLMVAWPAASALAGALMNRTGFRALVALGAASMVLGFGLLARLPASPAWALAASAGLVGVGMGLTSSTVLVASQAAVPKERLGMASAWLGVARNLGGALGLGALGALQVAALGSGHGPGEPYRAALEGSLRVVFAASALVAAACLAIATRMPPLTPREAAGEG